MDIACPNYEISLPSDGSERMLSFSARDILAHGVEGGDPVDLCVFLDGARLTLKDGTRVVFPNLPQDLRGQLLRHNQAWIGALLDSGRTIGVQWGGLVGLCVVEEPLPRID